MPFFLCLQASRLHSCRYLQVTYKEQCVCTLQEKSLHFPPAGSRGKITKRMFWKNKNKKSSDPMTGE